MMQQKLSVIFSQLNYKAGNIVFNKQKIINEYLLAVEKDADLIVFSELSLTGCFPEDLILYADIQLQCIDALFDIALLTEQHKTAVLVGGIWMQNEQNYNAMFLIADGQIISIIAKHSMDYSCAFNNNKLFTCATMPVTNNYCGLDFGILVGSDVWMPGLASVMCKNGAKLIFIFGAFPYNIHLRASLIEAATNISKENNVPVVYLGHVGGYGDVVFSGGSFVISADGKIVTSMLEWKENTIFTEWLYYLKSWHLINGPAYQKPYNENHSIYQAMIHGIRDYIYKNNFKGIVVGINNNDVISYFMALVAVDALGADSVLLVIVEKLDSANKSIFKKFISKLKLHNIVINSAKAIDTFCGALGKDFSLESEYIRINNCINYNLISSIAKNKNYAVGNSIDKSFLAVGDCVVYDGIEGSYAPFGDIYYIKLFELIKWRNVDVPDDAMCGLLNIIDWHIIKDNRYLWLYDIYEDDEDLLMLYGECDQILAAIIDQELSVEEIVALGYNKDRINKIYKMLRGSDYSRIFSPFVLKISRSSLGVGRKYPLNTGV